MNKYKSPYDQRMDILGSINFVILAKRFMESPAAIALTNGLERYIHFNIRPDELRLLMDNALDDYIKHGDKNTFGYLCDFMPLALLHGDRDSLDKIILKILMYKINSNRV